MAGAHDDLGGSAALQQGQAWVVKLPIRRRSARKTRNQNTHSQQTDSPIRPTSPLTPPIS